MHRDDEFPTLYAFIIYLFVSLWFSINFTLLVFLILFVLLGSKRRKKKLVIRYWNSKTATYRWKSVTVLSIASPRTRSFTCDPFVRISHPSGSCLRNINFWISLVVEYCTCWLLFFVSFLLASKLSMVIQKGDVFCFLVLTIEVMQVRPFGGHVLIIIN